MLIIFGVFVNKEMFSVFLLLAEQLTTKQRLHVLKQLAAPQDAKEIYGFIDKSFIDKPTCPYCKSASVQKWGNDGNLQRYRCKEEGCRKTFNALTKTPMARLRKKELWLEYGQSFSEHV